MFSFDLELPRPDGEAKGWPWTLDQPGSTLPDGTEIPRISVVVPSYDQDEYLEAAIRSVLLQQYPNVELIIIDGGSTDSSVDILKRYDPWIAYWVCEPDSGQSHAINKGITQASGEIIFWLNSDDICLPGAFHLVSQVFLSNPGVKIISGQAKIINKAGEVGGELRSYFESWEEMVTNPRNSIRQISTFFSAALFDRFGHVDETLSIAMDTELIVRFTQNTIPHVLDDHLAAYRVHEEAKTATQIMRGYQETDRSRTKYLRDKELSVAYRQRSAKNWISLAESERYPIGERLGAIWRAVLIRPQTFVTRVFWVTLKRVLSSRWRDSC